MKDVKERNLQMSILEEQPIETEDLQKTNHRRIALPWPQKQQRQCKNENPNQYRNEIIHIANIILRNQSPKKRRFFLPGGEDNPVLRRHYRVAHAKRARVATDLLGDSVFLIPPNPLYLSMVCCAHVFNGLRPCQGVCA